MSLGLIAVLVLSTAPIADGDIWWQMVYGKYFLDIGTLVPDHSIFSWTEANNIWIYCAWIAEITLYWIHDSFGLVGLFVLRYLAMLLPAILALWLANKYDSKASVFVWLTFLICYLMSYASGGLIKPELFSFMFMSVMVAIYFAIKSGGDSAWKLSYGFPVLILLWVNSHGGFVVGMVFLATAAFGELLNYLLSPKNALAAKTIRHLTIAAVLSVVAMFCTPYGWRYPAQLLFDVPDWQDLSTVVAYQSIYSQELKHLFHPLYLYLSAGIILPLLTEQIIRRRLDYAVLAINVLFVIFYVRMGRMTYFYALVMLFSIQYLLAFSESFKLLAERQAKLFLLASLVAICLMFILLGHRVLDRVTYPARDNSFNFGISNLNPVSEAEFVKENFSSRKLCNSYAGGGYLMWRLWPQQKVMIDPRYFPFQSWYGEWERLYSADSASVLPSFDCSVWVVNFKYWNLTTALRNSTEWALVFIGSSSAVYVRKSTLNGEWVVKAGEDLRNTKKIGALSRALNILVNNEELKLANELADSIEKRFRGVSNRPSMNKAVAYVRGVVAYYKQDYVTANRFLSESQDQPAPINNLGILLNTKLFLTRQLWEEGRHREALVVAVSGAEMAPDNAALLFNAGMIMLALNDEEFELQRARSYLTEFLRLAEIDPVVASSNQVERAKIAVQDETVDKSIFLPLVPGQRPPKLDALSLYY